MRYLISLFIAGVIAICSISNAAIRVDTGATTYVNSSGTATYAVTAGTATYSLASQYWHGVQSIGTVTFNNVTHALSFPTVTYWYKGTKVELSTTQIATIDSFVTITANKLYFIKYLSATSGLTVTTAAWSILEDIPVVTVYWNGSVGAVNKEWHSYDRNLQWHLWSHDTIGSRYEQGSTIAAPTSGNPTGLSISSGVYHDEDIDFTTGTITSNRFLYLANATTYTQATGTLPYTGLVGAPTFLLTTNYTLTTSTAALYIPYFYYITTDIDRPLYIVPYAGTAGLTLANAQAATPPSLAQSGLNPEFKLIYKVIYRGNGAFQEVTDYRTSSSLPSGGTAALAASSVTLLPTGLVTAVDVQAGVSQLDVRMADTIVSIGTVTANFTADFNTGCLSKVTVTANPVTVTIPDWTSATQMKRCWLYITQNPVAAKTVTIGAASGTNNNIVSSSGQISAGSALPNSGANATDAFEFTWNGVKWFTTSALYDIK